MSKVVSANATAICVVPWYPFPLHNGGALRAFHVVSQLGRFYDTTAIFPTSTGVSTTSIELEFKKTGSNIKVAHAVANPQRSIMKRVKDRVSTILSSGTLSQKSNLVSLSLLREIDSVMRRTKPSIIVLTELDSLLLVPRIRKLHPNVPIALDMHNVNHVLLRQYNNETNKTPRSLQHYNEVLKTESSLAKIVDTVLACSDHDLDILKRLNGPIFKGAVIPNGVDTNTAGFDSNRQKHELRNLIYCASLTTKANIDGMIWFAETIWPIIRKLSPDMRLTVVGSGSDNPKISHLKLDSSITFAGRVDELSTHYRDASVSICPLRIGSGTRLKVLEAMSYGTPVVSTALGCEGLNIDDGETLIIRDSPEEFATGIIELLANPTNFHRIRHNARRFVEETYDWNVIGRRLHSVLETL